MLSGKSKLFSYNFIKTKKTKQSLIFILDQKDQSFYIQKIQFILMYMFQHDQVLTRTAVAKQSVQAGGNIFYEKDLFNPSKDHRQEREKFFWTKDQRKLIEGNPKMFKKCVFLRDKL